MLTWARARTGNSRTLIVAIPYSMRAAVVRTFGQPLPIEAQPLPVPGPGEVPVRIGGAGVCRTDLRAADGDGSVKPELPLIPAREGLGRVAAPGAGAPHLKEGGMAGIAWLHNAGGHYEHRITGRETLCEARHNSGCRVNGCMAEYAPAEAADVARLPEHSDPAAVAPILCAGMTAVHRLSARLA